MSINFPKGTR